MTGDDAAANRAAAPDMRRRGAFLEVAIGANTAAILESIRRASEAVAKTLASLGDIPRRLGRVSPASVDVAPARHVFMPNLDLVCVRCRRGPEECNGRSS